MSERLRFAPSPTGALHLGNARTALINWLVARASGGTLVLRIEDTDRQRNVPGAERGIIEDLRWLGLDWDEGPDVGGDHGPYRQSERTSSYREAVSRLLECGAAYYCFEDAQAVRASRAEAARREQPFRWPGRALDPEVARARVAAGESAVVRLRAPEGEARFVDGLRGETGMAAEQVGDFVLARADGSPTYQLAVVVDDHAMRVTHVIRGQDHLSNTPGQVWLYEALGWRAPRFTHLPLVLGPDRSRLSKRHGAASVASVREQGIPGAALANYLVLLGWAPPDDEEVQGVQQLVASFTLEGLSPTNVVFDRGKLDWLSQQHLQRLAPPELLSLAEPFLAAAGIHVGDDSEVRGWWSDVVQLLVPGIHRLTELRTALEPLTWRPPAGRGVVSDAEAAAMRQFVAAARAGALANAEDFRRIARDIAAASGLRGRALFHPLRELLTGAGSGPELARLVPLIERGARLAVQPTILSVVERLGPALGGDG